MLARATAPGALALALALAACGSQRLDTAAEPAHVVEGGSAGVGGSRGTPSPGDSGAGGADPVPLVTEPLVTLADFGASYMVGPITAERFQLSGQPFQEAWRATMSEPPSSPWAAQLVMPLGKAVQADQLLHVSFWLSCEVPGTRGDCYTEYIFERDGEPWEKSVTFVAHAGAADWSRKSEYFSSVSAYGPGGAHMVFRLGYEGQVIAIGGLEVEAIDPSP